MLLSHILLQSLHKNAASKINHNFKEKFGRKKKSGVTNLFEAEGYFDSIYFMALSFSV